MSRISILVAACFAIFTAVPVFSSAEAQDRDLPYWAAINSEEVNMRVGPSVDFPIDWVYKRNGLPVKVIRLREGWRLVQDHEGTQGWIVASLLTDQRGMIVIGEGLATMRAGPSTDDVVRWRAEPGVVGKLIRCRDDWCEINVDGRIGWLEQTRVWGDGEP